MNPVALGEGLAAQGAVQAVAVRTARASGPTDARARAAS